MKSTKKIEAVAVDSRDVTELLRKGLTYEDAIRQAARPMTIEEGHWVFDDLEMDLLCVRDKVMYGLSVKHILGEGY